jgi:hypothetical protein
VAPERVQRVYCGVESYLSATRRWLYKRISR